MNERATNRRRWRIGELAEATGLTVRTLHHYEHVGLLAAPSRTEGRQRLYDERDVRRIYRICALRDVGLALTDIRRILTNEKPELADVLCAHRSRIDAEIARLRKLRVLVDHACTTADRDIAPDTLLATIEAMSRVVRRGEARKKLDGSTKGAEARWRALGNELRACRKAGDAPAAARPRAVAQKVLARITEFAGGDGATMEALAHLRRFAPPKKLAGWTPALMQYLDQCLASLPKKEREPC